MPTNAELVDAAMRYFFETALPEATGKRLGDLPSPKVHVGAYAAWTGGAVATSAGQQITPRYALRIGPELPTTQTPQGAATAVPESAPVRHLVWMRHKADARADDAAEIQRVMADLDSFADVLGLPASSGEEGTPASSEQPAPTTQAAAARAAEWARAVTESRDALANLSSLQQVPPAFSGLTTDVTTLRTVLRHFFTYADDGAHYARWAGTGRDADNPAHLTPEYKTHNVREVQLDREEIYLYGVVPEGILARTGDLGGGMFREIVVRFTPAADDGSRFTLNTLHTARWRRDAAPFTDFVFFYAGDGAGLPVPREVRARMSSGLMSLAAHDYDLAALRPGVGASPGQAARPDMVHLVAMVEGEPALPQGVLQANDGNVRLLISPPEQVPAIAALPQVRRLGVVSEHQLFNDLASNMVRAADLMAKLPAAKREGAGTLVGVIDTGIDGTHRAFTGRIHAVWDQGHPNPATSLPVAQRKTPAAANPGNAAYTAFNWGVELTGADVSHSVDLDGHGTHVAGIAAGAAVRDPAGAVLMPAGICPQARIAAVRAIATGGTRNDVVAGALWIFQKATELGVPCVINMSFGHHQHAHDGTDDTALALFNVLRSNNAYRPSRSFVAAAGNQREFKMHTWRRVAADNRFRRIGRVRTIPQQADGTVRAFERVDVWVRNPTQTCPVAFPLDLWIYIVPPAGGVIPAATRIVAVGSQATGLTTPPDPTAAAGTFAAQNTRIHVTSEMSNPVNGDHHFMILFQAIVPANGLSDTQWDLTLRNNTGHELEAHAWLPWARRDAGANPDSATFTDMLANDNRFLVGSPATNPSTVSVASCNSRTSWPNPANPGGPPVDLSVLGPLNEISVFSSPGPLRRASMAAGTMFANVTHEINAVDVTAPGAVLFSALSAQARASIQANEPHAVINNDTYATQGTSMASPVVAGLTAALLADEPNLTQPQILERLKAASTIPAATTFDKPAAPAGQKPLSRDWGYGLVNGGQLKP